MKAILLFEYFKLESDSSDFSIMWYWCVTTAYCKDALTAHSCTVAFCDTATLAMLL